MTHPSSNSVERDSGTTASPLLGTDTTGVQRPPRVAHTEGPWTVFTTRSFHVPGIEAGCGESIVIFGDGSDDGGVRGRTPEEIAANARLIAALPILDDLYASEINFEIATFWDGGFDIKLGDDMNGYRAIGQVRSFVEAAEQLRDWAIEHYPVSEFTKKYGGQS